MRKIVDISPPRREETEEKEKNTGVLFFLLLSLALVVGLAAIVLHVFFSQASIEITPRFRTLTIDKDMNMKGQVFSEEVSSTKLYSSSGSKLSETKAQGTIRVFNNQLKLQILVANTRFLSEERKLFRSTNRIEIPAGGFVDVEVIAAEAGEDYNIDPSNFSVPGLAGSPLYTLVYGKSLESMSGGARVESKVVTSADIEMAKEQLRKDVFNLGKEKITKRIVPPLVLAEDTWKEEILKLDSPLKPGAELEQFSVTGTLRVLATVLREDDVQILVENAFEENLEPTEQLNKESISFSFRVKSAKAEGDLIVGISAKAKAFVPPDLNELRSKLQGKKKDEAFAILTGYDTIEQFKLSLLPFWLTTIPRDQSKIEIFLSLE